MASPLVQVGAEKIVTIHSPISDQVVRDKVNNTLKEVKKRFPITIEQMVVSQTSFMGFVNEFIRLFNSFEDSDDIFVHIGGGERHIGIALVYASSFSKKNIHLIPVLEYGHENVEYKYALIPPLMPVELTSTQRKVLKMVSNSPGLTLKDLALIENPEKPQSTAPSLSRHLRNLVEYHLVDYDPKSRGYAPSGTASLFLN